ncbi:MAG TPA: hypothetical protein VK191_12070 [Symbiobacteriaceae bacterium]|nr:hypothetical protein [Symbiobacteriaceae bacterium]
MAWQTPLIVRCWDSVADRAVVDGLVLFLYPDGRSGRPVQGFPNPDGTFLFHGVPELLAWQAGSTSTGTAAYWLTVVDRDGRYLQATLSVSLPTESPLMLYLFAASTRRFPGAVAELRADLWQEETDAPAAWAVLEATEGGRTWYGIADGDGRVLLPFPFPRATGTGSPTWPVSLKVRTGAAPLAGVGPLEIPPLDQILSQPVGQIRAAPGDPVVGVLDVTLTMGGPVVLRTGTGSRLAVRSS